MRASPAEFAASLRNLSAPSLVHIAEDARGRQGCRREGPTGSSVQAVTAACCAVYAGAGVGVAREEGEEGAVFARFYCTDLGRAAVQPGTDSPPPSL